MYTLEDKQKLEQLKTESKDTYDFVCHLLDTQESTLKKGCHELQNILALIIGNLQLFEFSNPQFNRPEIQNNSNWNAVKNNLCYLSKFMTSVCHFRYAHKLHKTTFNLGNMINELIINYNFDITLQSDPTNPDIYADREKISYIIKSILDNIAETNIIAPVNITVDIDNKNNCCKIVVSDVYPPIDPETAKNFFFPFNTNKTDHAGLSLATSNLIAIAHNGSLTYSYCCGNHFNLVIGI